MKQAGHRISISTSRKGLYEFTKEIQRWLSRQGFATGLLTVFVRHTSASLLIQENADPNVVTIKKGGTLGGRIGDLLTLCFH